MTQHITIPAIAAHRFPHGSPVRIDGDQAYLEADLAKIHGVTKRPPQAGGATDHEKGEPLRVLTDGYQLSALPDGTRWTELRGGKVLP